MGRFIYEDVIFIYKILGTMKVVQSKAYKKSIF